MKRLFKVVLIAVLALVAVSCKPSLVGEWQYVRAEYYEAGELVEVDDEADDWSLQFRKDGTGYEHEYGEGNEMYWMHQDDVLYVNDYPIGDLDEAGSLQVKFLNAKELHLMWEDLNMDYAEVYVFRKIKR